VQQGRDTLPIGSSISGGSRDRYIVEAILGKGGFGTIYLVRDQRVKQNLYALKEVIDPNKRELEHLSFECEILRHIEHPSLPRLQRVFEDTKSNRVYILMDYIEGPNLEQLRHQYFENRIALPRMLSIMAPIMEAISFLHHQGPPIVHRDIKPSNIIVPTANEKAVLVDFGIAKVYEPEATTTAIRQCSPGYGAPEQYGIGTTPRTDIYGLGATSYTLLTGKVPVDSLLRMIQLSEKDADPLVPMQQIVPTLPDHVAETIQRAMSVRRNDRFASVEEFWQTLTAGAEWSQSSEPLFASLPFQSQPDVITDPKHRSEQLASSQVLKTLPVSRPKRWRIMLISALILLVLLGGVGIATIYWTSALRSAHPVAAKTHALPSPTSSAASPRPNATVYPLLIRQYSGTINDMVANSTTNMSLSNIQQQGRTILGNFVGLGLTGKFVGTIDTIGNLQFQVPIFSSSETISFQGNVKLGGSIVGSYRILNQNGEFTGEYGLWSISPG